MMIRCVGVDPRITFTNTAVSKVLCQRRLRTSPKYIPLGSKDGPLDNRPRLLLDKDGLLDMERLLRDALTNGKVPGSIGEATPPAAISVLLAQLHDLNKSGEEEKRVGSTSNGATGLGGAGEGAWLGNMVKLKGQKAAIDTGALTEAIAWRSVVYSISFHVC